MKRALLLLFCACVHVPMQTTSSPSSLDAKALMGTWYIIETNFPRWLDGQRTNPRFVYSNLRQEDGLAKCDDLVLSAEGGNEERIEGIDTQHPQVPSHFTWRGVGWLSLFTSEWDVAALSPDGQWAIIAFTATLFTPAGVDIISRAPSLDAESLAKAQALIAADPTLAKLGEGLKRAK